MKQFAKQKWVLSALLITALGSQYYFSTSSNQVHSVEMASEADTVESLENFAAILAAANPVTPANPSAPSVPANPSSAAETEGVAPTVPGVCKGCALLHPEEVAILNRLIAEKKAALKAAGESTEVPAIPANETPNERKLRLLQEAEQRRSADAKAKAEIERREKKARNEEFKLKMRSAAEECAGDVTCLTSEYTSLLGDHTGKDKIDSSYVANAYIQYIQPALKDAVSADGNDAAAREALQNIAMDIPVEYRAIKEQSINDVKDVAGERAQAANQNFILAEKYRKENRTEQSLQAFNQATSEARDFERDMTSYSNVIRSGASDDAATLAYMQRNFMPEIARLFNNMNNLNGLNMATGNDPNSASGSRVRGAQPATTDENGKMTTLPSTGGVQFGQPTNTQTGSRVRGQ